MEAVNSDVKIHKNGKSELEADEVENSFLSSSMILSRKAGTRHIRCREA